jgi:hypothetical protein
MENCERRRVGEAVTRLGSVQRWVPLALPVLNCRSLLIQFLLEFNKTDYWKKRIAEVYVVRYCWHVISVNALRTGGASGTRSQLFSSCRNVKK